MDKALRYRYCGRTGAYGFGAIDPSSVKRVSPHAENDSTLVVWLILVLDLDYNV